MKTRSRNRGRQIALQRQQRELERQRQSQRQQQQQQRQRQQRNQQPHLGQVKKTPKRKKLSTTTPARKKGSQSTTSTKFKLGDVVLCQYDTYPLWPAVIQKASEGPCRGKYHTMLTASDGTTVEAFNCYFVDDDSSGWIRGDLIVKFHPSIVPYVRASNSSFSIDQSDALNLALVRFTSDNSINENDPLASDARSQDCRLTVVRMLGQWLLLGRHDPRPARLVIGQFDYDRMLIDGRLLPEVLRANLGASRIWPRTPLPTVDIGGHIISQPQTSSSSSSLSSVSVSDSEHGSIDSNLFRNVVSSTQSNNNETNDSNGSNRDWHTACYMEARRSRR